MIQCNWCEEDQFIHNPEICLIDIAKSTSTECSIQTFVLVTHTPCSVLFYPAMITVHFPHTCTHAVFTLSVQWSGAASVSIYPLVWIARCISSILLCPQSDPNLSSSPSSHNILAMLLSWSNEIFIQLWVSKILPTAQRRQRIRRLQNKLVPKFC